RQALQGEVDALGAARREHHLGRAAAQNGSHASAGVVQTGGGGATDLVMAGGVAEGRREVGPHGLQHRPPQRSGAGVVEIDEVGHDAAPITRSSPMSRAGAEWVSAPTEITSTPVSAMARTVSRVTPPLASTSARPATCSTALAMSATLKLSSRITSGSPSRTSSIWP